MQCRCGKQIFFGKTMDGKTIPLDTEAPVYRDISNPNDPVNGDAYIERDRRSYVSHFATCKFASDFSKRNKHEAGN